MFHRGQNEERAMKSEFDNSVQRAILHPLRQQSVGQRIKRYLTSRDVRETLGMFAVLALFILALCLPI